MEEVKLGHVTINHVNIRESISILLLKLVTLDFLAAIFTILFFTFVSFSPSQSLTEKILSFNVLYFILLGLAKICFTTYVILLWLNEYYEITPTEIVHKKGLVYRYEKRYRYDNVKTIKLYQGFLGRVFNYGTIGLYDIRRNLRVEMYLIHNPQRYMRILEHLIENVHEERREIRRTIFEEEAEDDEVTA